MGQDEEIQDVAQVIDGKWTLDSVGVRTAETGYDRNLGFGDVFWNDYEVTVPVVFHTIPADYGVGVVLRWNGHTDFPRTCPQPKCGWLPLGVIAWYNNGRLQLYGNNGQILANGLPRVLSAETTYLLKARVETTDAGAVYSMKLWEEGQPEPGAWEITGQEELNDPQRGSAVLIAHQADVSFGNVAVTQVGNGANRTPVANDNEAYVAPGGSVLIDILANDTDAGGLLDPTTVELVSNPSNGTASVNGTTGVVTYSHNGSATTSDSFTYRVKDDEGAFSNVATVSLIITDDIPDQIRSDDFNACALQPQWSFENPLGAGSYALVGSGTGSNAYLSLSVPAGTSHDAWGAEGNEALRVMQPAPNADFEVEAAFNTEPTGDSNDQGIIVEQDAENYLRFDVYHNGAAVKAFMGRVIDGEKGTLANKTIPTGDGKRIRVIRQGNQWTMQYYSAGASAWVTVGTSSQALQVNKVGVMAANPTGAAYTAEADYFFNLASPIDPEDGGRNEVVVTVEGFGGSNVTPTTPDGYYACGTEITLQAVADAGNKFQKWSGDVTGNENPVTLTIDGPVAVTATFVEGNVNTTPPVITLNGANPYTLM